MNEIVRSFVTTPFFVATTGAVLAIGIARSSLFNGQAMILGGLIVSMIVVGVSSLSSAPFLTSPYGEIACRAGLFCLFFAGSCLVFDK
ncbi:MAG: hypothetical protein K8F91_05565 [Candidatus Obscuribacterales bacterium]|nr:hypothetical protein [Candidatus Obscuribacterales bacterium]